MLNFPADLIMKSLQILNVGNHREDIGFEKNKNCFNSLKDNLYSTWDHTRRLY